MFILFIGLMGGDQEKDEEIISGGGKLVGRLQQKECINRGRRMIFVTRYSFITLRNPLLSNLFFLFL